MSLLNLNNHDNGNEHLDTELVDFSRPKDDTSNIFEEIEQLLRHNECLEHSNGGIQAKSASLAPSAVAEANNPRFERELDNPPTTTASTPNNNFDLNSDSNEVPLNFLPTYTAHDFLIPDDTHNFQEDPLLYSVNRNELEPITSPFMVPGIYKKIAPAPASAEAKNALPSSEGGDTKNVYISEKEPNGRIVSRTDFKKLYTAGNGDGVKTKIPAILGQHKNVKNPTPINDVKSKNWESLSKLAYSIFKYSSSDHIVIDNSRNQVVRTHGGTNQKTIYRFLEPDALGLTCQNAKTHSTSNKGENKKTVRLKLGRPKKRPMDGSSKQPPPSNSKQNCIDPVKVIETVPPLAAPKEPQLRTRSGRVVKLVRPLLKPTANADVAAPAEIFNDLPNLLTELKDSDYNGRKVLAPPALTKSADNDIAAVEPLANSTPLKRRVPPESICPTCKKIFLGKRMQRHLAQHPDHIRPVQTTVPQSPPPQTQSNIEALQSQNTDDMTLFRFLITKLQKSNLNEDQRADLFLSELNDLIEQLQLRSSRLIRNTSGLHFLTARIARVLGIPEGQYALDMSALEAPPELESNYEPKQAISLPPMATVNARSLDYTAISLDDTLTDEAAQKLNLSAGGKLLPPSEESLLRAVGDLVHEDMSKLVATTLQLHAPVNAVDASEVGTLVSHYDNANDNAVEAMNMKEMSITRQTAPLLDLSVDFFQFKNN